MKAWNSFILGLGYIYLFSLFVVFALYVIGSWEAIRWRLTIAKAQRKEFLKEMDRHQDVAVLEDIYRLK